jgi:hypothetical protein
MSEERGEVVDEGLAVPDEGVFVRIPILLLLTRIERTDRQELLLCHDDAP